MGAGKSYSSGRPHYNATIACVIAEGPLYGLQAILLNGEAVWEGPALRGTSTGPLVINTAYGLLRIYWGTDNQPADPTLNQYAYHPPYPGIAYCVFVDFDHGSATNAYNAEFICLKAPAQSVVTGTAASSSLDQCRTCNAAVFAAEVITSERWLGRPAGELDTASFQAVADALQAEQVAGAPAGRSIAAVSPLITDATETRSLLSDLLSPLGAWLRVRPDGLIQAGRWPRDAEALAVPELTLDDLSETPVVAFEDEEDAPNSLAVEFTDSEALHKGASLTVDDAGAIAEQGVLRRTTIKRPWLITADQAIRAGLDELARAGRVASWSGEVRFPRALDGSGNLIAPGDLRRVPVGVPGSTDTAILRVLKVTRPRDATGGVAIEGELDPGYRELETAAAVEASGSGSTGAVPPVMWSRVLALPSQAIAEPPPVVALAARPHDLAIGLEVGYDSAAAGDFPPVGRQAGFALPVRLAASFSSSATTVRLRLLDAVDGANPRRDEVHLRGWSGGATEGRNDELLVVLLRTDGSGGIARRDDAPELEQVEVISIASAPSLVSTDTFQANVLRGRLGTAALAWNTGTFPLEWADVEGWVIPRYLMTQLAHNDFAGMLATGTPGYFRLTAYTARVFYAAAAAWEERTRRASAELALAEFAAQPAEDTHVPQVAYAIPAGLNNAPRIEWIAPASFPATATGGDLAVQVRWIDSTGDLSEVLLAIVKADGTGYAEVLRQSLSPRASHEWSGTVNFPSTGTWTLSAVGTDGTGQTGRSDQTVTR